MNYKQQLIQGEYFTIPEEVDLKKCIDMYETSIDVVENLCIYLCQGHEWSKALEVMMHIPHTHVKRYLALRTPETDQIVKRYGDGKWYIVRYLEICNEHGENPSTYQRYLSTPGGCKFGLLALCTTLKTGVIVENYRFILNSGRYDYTTYVYKQLLASVYADKEVNKLLNHFGIDDYSHYIPREILYFVDIVMSLGIDITPFLRIKFREYKARTIYSCAQTLKSDDSITFYAELGLNDEELENVIKQACRMRKRSTTAVGILDMSEISIKEM